MKEIDVEELIKGIALDKHTLSTLRYLVNGSYIRVVNYHNTDPMDAERIEQEIKAFSENYCSVSISDLDDFFLTHKWKKDKPGLIPAVFEGFRNQYDVMFPILEKYNFRGWYYLPSYFIDIAVKEQLEYTKHHDLTVYHPEVYPDGRYAMTWDEVKKIAEHHEICCHSGHHFQIFRDTSEEDMQIEIVDAKKYLEEKIGREVDVFCWLYGEEFSYNVRAQKYLYNAGYKYVLSNLKLEKIR